MILIKIKVSNEFCIESRRNPNCFKHMSTFKKLILEFAHIYCQGYKSRENFKKTTHLYVTKKEKN